jgi:hypothetical protein
MRDTKEEPPWFKHRFNHSQSDDILFMRSKWGAKGLGWYWLLTEKMRSLPDKGYKICVNKKRSWFSICNYLDESDQNQIKEFITDCTNEYEIFQTDGEFIWCSWLLTEMKEMNKTSKKRQFAANARWEPDRQKLIEEASKLGIEDNLSKLKIPEIRKVISKHSSIITAKNDNKNKVEDSMQMHSTCNANALLVEYKALQEQYECTCKIRQDKTRQDKRGIFNFLKQQLGTRESRGTKPMSLLSFRKFIFYLDQFYKLDGYTSEFGELIGVLEAEISRQAARVEDEVKRSEKKGTVGDIPAYARKILDALDSGETKIYDLVEKCANWENDKLEKEIGELENKLEKVKTDLERAALDEQIKFEKEDSDRADKAISKLSEEDRVLLENQAKMVLKNESNRVYWDIIEKDPAKIMIKSKMREIAKESGLI